MLVTGIKSKPVYAPLQADVRGRYHLMVGMGVGAAPLLRVIAEMTRRRGAVIEEYTRILFVPDGGAMHFGAAHAAAPEVEQFRARGGRATFRPSDSTPELLGRFQDRP